MRDFYFISMPGNGNNCGRKIIHIEAESISEAAGKLSKEPNKPPKEPIIS